MSLLCFAISTIQPHRGFTWIARDSVEELFFVTQESSTTRGPGRERKMAVSVIYRPVVIVTKTQWIKNYKIPLEITSTLGTVPHGNTASELHSSGVRISEYKPIIRQLLKSSLSLSAELNKLQSGKLVSPSSFSVIFLSQTDIFLKWPKKLS